MRNIIIGYDGSPAARLALARAADLASGATVTVVSVVHVAPQFGRAAEFVDDEEIAARRKELRVASAALRERGVAGTTGLARHVDPAEAILEEAEKVGADLIVVGSRAMSAASRVLLGSVSTKIVHEAGCDVLVVRGEAQDRKEEAPVGTGPAALA